MPGNPALSGHRSKAFLGALSEKRRSHLRRPQEDNRGAVPPEPQTNPLRKRKRGKVFTAADSTPIQARIPNAMFLEIERAARHELVSIADFVRAALLEKLKRERDKNESQ
jgi:hypothetical protein